MKSLPIVLGFLSNPSRRRNFLVLARLLGVFFALVALFSALFHKFMEWEGREYSWTTSVYWTLVTMSTLGFGDITFQSDVGRLFSVVVLMSGTVFLLVLLPFMFIQFFYVPWMEAQAAARAPRELPEKTEGHVLITALDSVTQSLIRLMTRSGIPYAVIVPDLTEALRLHDEGYRVMLGDVDDPETYARARAARSALVAATGKDTTNTNVAFTVREISETVPILATASFEASVDILELAGCNQVLQLAEILGQGLARRALGRDARSRVVGRFKDLLIAEASAAGTPLIGRTLGEIRLRDHANVTVVGVWDRGKFQIAGPDTKIRSTTVLMLAGTREQLDLYDGLFCIYRGSDAPVVIIGGGRVGRATAGELLRQGLDYRLVERMPERIHDPQRYVLGNAAELEVLKRAGVMETGSVVITTHDDDTNIYLAIYCRKLRPDVQILGRANQERNVSTLHRAGADFVMSYASTGSSMIFNALKHADILLLAEGLDVFRIPTPRGLAGRTLAQSQIRRRTGCNVVAVAVGDEFEVNPDPNVPVPADSEIVLIGDTESETRFFKEFKS